jgi:hypothetical protein
MKKTMTALTVLAALGAGVATAQAESGYKVGGAQENRAPVSTILSEGPSFQDPVIADNKF